jgi:hypothetical protein
VKPPSYDGGGSETTTDEHQPPIKEEKESGKEDGEASEMQQKIKTVQEYAEHVANVAELVGFAAKVLAKGNEFVFLGPGLNFLAAFVYLIIVDKGGDFSFLEKGVESALWLLEKLGEWLWSLMPDWVKAAWEKIKAWIGMDADEAAEEIGDMIKEACNTIFGDTFGPVMQPLFDWLGNRCARLVRKLGDLGDSWYNWAAFILEMMVGSIGDIRELASAVGDVITMPGLLARRRRRYHRGEHGYRQHRQGSMVCVGLYPWAVQRRVGPER